MIVAFTGPHRFLSNFYPAPLEIGGVLYPTVEHAFAAAKTRVPEARAAVIAAATPGEAKRLGRLVPLRPDWEEKKVTIMRGLVRAKFTRHADLRALLLATRPRGLIEGNTWHDNFWGACSCVRCYSHGGLNRLGQILIAVRAEMEALG